jgi:hypothetical protein
MLNNETKQESYLKDNSDAVVSDRVTCTTGSSSTTSQHNKPAQQAAATTTTTTTTAIAHYLPKTVASSPMCATMTMDRFICECSWDVATHLVKKEEAPAPGTPNNSTGLRVLFNASNAASVVLLNNVSDSAPNKHMLDCRPRAACTLVVAVVAVFAVVAVVAVVAAVVAALVVVPAAFFNVSGAFVVAFGNIGNEAHRFTCF